MNEVTRCSLEEAINRVKASISPDFKIEEIDLLEASGRVLAENVMAPHNQPPFPRSPLDGYALRGTDSTGATKDTPVKLTVIDEVMAGSVSNVTVGKMQAVRIMTGAPIPSGADCVIRQEDTDYGEEEVTIYQALNPYDNYCFIGEDYKEGELLLRKGTLLSAAEIGLLASFGRITAKVYELPKIHLITTGDELIMPGQPLAPGKIYDSNLYSIGIRLKELGYSARLHHNVMDDAKNVAEEIRKAAKTAKLILTTGGVSVGKKDIMHEVLRILGAERLFWKMDLKPGTPTLCAKYKDTLLICLSGNPFGSITNFEIFVRPVLAYLSHNPSMNPVKQKGILQNDFGKPSKVRRYVRAVYENKAIHLPQGSHASGAISSLCGCNCLIEIPSGSEAVHKGDEVQVWML